MKIYSVTDPEFAPYGRVLDLDTAAIVDAGDTIPMPEGGSSYEPGRPEFEALPIAETMRKEIFGDMETQVGYCWGHSHQLNALEWHTCSEVNVAVRDLILLLGERKDIEPGNRYDSAKIKAFRLNRGQAIEVYATTLHFCPIEVEPTGFGCVVGLLKGTNTPLAAPTGDPLLFRTNKWLIAHEENAALIARGVVPGIYGENYTL